MFGATAEREGETYVVDLVDDPAAVDPAERNTKFETWVETLKAWEDRVERMTGSGIERRRIDHLSTGAFDFFADDGVAVELLGPIVEDLGGMPGLPFLKSPPDDADLMLGTVAPDDRGSLSASHTINGHSINFRLRYGNVRFLFTGDMNQESSRRLREAMPAAALRAEVLKAPHHGSADFDMEFLKEIGPVVSLISSGDESAAKEYIHPRATLMAALGKATLGYVEDPKDRQDPKRRVFAFERTNFGIAHVRTDGHRVLAFTHSGKRFMNEAYRFTVSATGEVEFAKAVVKRSAPRRSD
ncbi:unnamed protein product [Sordaria macrospora k-hell]|uniref:WGS project CABT00000000 data, contig 2.289 n=1 Tax=Sordaria macrospora (strain ATCC MYA-333 / DSM 997 / K(L3346) / K-hell) TaxID=771870 RepID=F7WCV3_SORMK|nr:unnamed protein product [Sordaria macrospora k-hell]